MEVHRKIIRNSAWLYFSEFITKIIMFFFIIYLARTLGDEQFGVFTFAFSFVFLFTGLITFGMDSLLVRDCSLDKSKMNAYLGNMVVFRIIMSLMVVLIIPPITYALGYPLSTMKIVGIASLFLVASSITQLFLYALRVYENMKYEAIIRIVEKGILAIVGATVLFFGSRLLGISIVYLLSGTIAAGLSIYFFLKRSITFKFQFKKEDLFQIIKDTLPFIFLVIFFDIYLKVDITILSVLKGDQVTGWYGASSKIIELLIIVPIILNRALLPTIASVYKEMPSQIPVLYKFISKYLFIISMPVFLFSLIMSKKIIKVLFGEDYIGASVSLIILSCALIFIYQSFHNHHFLLAVRKEKIAAIIMGSLILLNVILDIIVIPYLSLNGAAATTLFCNIVFYIITLFILKRMVKDINIIGTISKIIFVNILFLFFVYFLREVNFFLVLISAIVFYFVCLLLFRVITRGDILFVFETIMGKKKFNKLMGFLH